MRKILLSIFVFLSILSSNDIIKDSTDIKTDGKAVLLLFSTNTCEYCKIFKKDMKENKKLNELVKKMNVYEIKRDEYKEYTMWGKKTNLRSMERAFMVKITPNIIIFDKEGKRIWQLPGYADPSMMIDYISFVQGLNNGKYKITQWRKYLEDKNIISKK
jgi:thioredoxin-related protein